MYSHHQNDNVSTNSLETKTNLILRTRTTNNADYINNILFQNTGSFFNIALTRRYDTNVGSNKSNFCIQTGASGSITGLPVRFVVRNDGKVNIGSSQTKTAGFNVESTSNFESTVTATSFVGPLTGNSATSTKIDSITNSNIVQLTSNQTLSNKTLTNPTVTGVLFFTGSRIDLEPSAGSDAVI